MTSDDDPIDTLGADGDRRTMRESASDWLQHLWTRLGLAEQPTLRDKLEVLLKEEAKASGGFSPEERKMLSGLLRFGASRVDEIMVPRADIIALEETEPWASWCGCSKKPAFRAFRSTTRRSTIRGA